LARLLKYFRFSENDKKVNQNHLKDLFYRFMVAVQKVKTFQTDSPLKYFDFFPFETVSTDSSRNEKCFTLPNMLLLVGKHYVSYNMTDRITVL
jgi:hypothetical protein